MPDRVEFKTAYVFPPEREGRVIELYVQHEEVLHIPAHVYRVGGEVMLTIFGTAGDSAWVYPLSDFRAALDAAVVALDTPPKPPVRPSA
jgi:hypothetical protein